MNTIITRETLEGKLDAVDKKNTHAVVTLESGAFKKETKYYVCWDDVSTSDNKTVDLEVHICAENVPYPIDETITFSADNPVEGIDNEIQYYNDVLEAGSFRDKAECLGFNVDSIAEFSMSLDVLCMIMMNYLTDLKNALTDVKIDLTDLKAVLEDTEIDMTDF